MSSINNASNQEKIDLLVKQYQAFNKSNKNIMKMITSKKAKKEWSNNYHLIYHSWLEVWKEIIDYDNLFGKNKDDDYKYIYSSIEKNIQSKNVEELNNQKIYYDIKDKYIIDPTKDFDLITDEAWSLFDIKNKNSKYNGKVSISIGLKKIIIKFDENNYLVKYLKSKNDSGEFIIIFNPPENEYKKEILDDISKKNISNWMEEVSFIYLLPQFTINKYKIPFDIKQKTNNFLGISFSSNLSEIDFNEASQFISSSKNNFSFSSIHLNLTNKSNSSTSKELDSFSSDIKHFTFIKKYKNTSNICAVMNCLSFIEPLADYFMSIIKNYKILYRFGGLIQLIKEYFLNVWSGENNAFEPKDLIETIKKEVEIKVDEEQDPIKFLEFIINYINTSLKVDENINMDFYKIKELLKNETYYDELNTILNNNNSIIGSNFFGLLLEIYQCEKCENVRIEKINEFKIINIDFISIINQFLQPGNVMTEIEIDQLLEYFFLKKGKSLVDYCQICPKCNKKIKINKREILKYPQYLIIRLDRGEFKEKKGFINNINIKFNNSNISLICDILKNIKRYYSNHAKKYNCEYHLISRINYEDINESIKFNSSCKSPNNEWILFDFISPPKKELNTTKKSIKSEGKDNNNSQPYILFYEFKLNQK